MLVLTIEMDDLLAGQGGADLSRGRRRDGLFAIEGGGRRHHANTITVRYPGRRQPGEPRPTSPHTSGLTPEPISRSFVGFGRHGTRNCRQTGLPVEGLGLVAVLEQLGLAEPQVDLVLRFFPVA